MERSSEISPDDSCIVWTDDEGPALWEPFLASETWPRFGAVGSAVVEYAESSEPSSPGVEDAQGSQGPVRDDEPS